MKMEVFTELLDAAHEALDHARDKRLRTATHPLPPRKSGAAKRGSARAEARSRKA